MKPSNFSRLARNITYALVLGTASLSPAMAADSAHSHDGHSVSSAQLKLNNGQKWDVDAPLQKGMGTLHAAVSKAVPAAHEGKSEAPEYQALVKTAGEQIEYMIQNCKLEPDADITLHVLIGEIINGANTIEGKTEGKSPSEGVVQMVKALDTYGEYFNHPGWESFSAH